MSAFDAVLDLGPHAVGVAGGDQRADEDHLPDEAAAAAAGQRNFDRDRPAGDFLGAVFGRAEEPFDAQPIDAHDLHDAFAGGDPLALVVQQGNHDSVERRNDLAAGHGIFGEEDVDRVRILGLVIALIAWNARLSERLVEALSVR